MFVCIYHDDVLSCSVYTVLGYTHRLWRYIGARVGLLLRYIHCSVKHKLLSFLGCIYMYMSVILTVHVHVHVHVHTHTGHYIYMVPTCTCTCIMFMCAFPFRSNVHDCSICLKYSLQDYVHFSLARHCYSLQRLRDARLAFEHLLDHDSAQSAPQQLLTLREYIYVHKVLRRAHTHVIFSS